MKVLRIYDHLGELKKEFNVYVEGEDFMWQASYPEPVWFGMITLIEAGKEPEAEPTPKIFIPEPELVPEEERERLLLEKARQEEEMGIRAEEEEEVEPQVPFITPLTTTDKKPKEEVKHEPKKVHRKRGRVKRTSPSDYLKSVKVLRQDDPGRDTNQGD